MTNADFQAQLATMQAQIDQLQTLILDILPASKLPAMPTLAPDATDRIVKLRADLFHNPPKKGRAEWRIKLFVWLDSNRAMQGSIAPLMFDLRRVGNLDIKQWDDSLYARLARKLDSDAMIGCLTHKQQGTKQHKDHVIVLQSGELMIAVNEWVICLTEREDLRSATPKAPVTRWYWNRED